MYESDDDNTVSEISPLTGRGRHHSNVTPSSIRMPWDPRRGKLAGGLVLGTLTLERLAFYAVNSNLYVFLTTSPTPWSSEEALGATLTMLGLAYFSALPAGWLADIWLGRFWTITGGLMLYVTGYTLLALLAADYLVPLGCNRHDGTSTCAPHIFFIIVLIGLAVGTLKANLPPFGAEQVRGGGAHSLRVYFNWYYWCINGGALVGIGALSYVEQDVGRGVGFPVAFAVATGVLVLGLLFMLLGRPIFVIHRPSSASLIGSLFHMVKEAIIGKCKLRSSFNEIQSSPILSHRDATRASPEPEETTYQSISQSGSIDAPSWLDFAKVRYGGSHHDAAVDEVKRLGPVLLLLGSLLPYWLVYLQSDSGFQAQAVHLDVSLEKFQVPTAWLGLLDELFVLALIPAMNGIVYPALDSRGRGLSLVSRIGIGMVFATVAVSSAGGLESWSIHQWNLGHKVVQSIGNKTYNASDVSVLWQVPQYCLLGTAEVFASVGGLELAHASAPRALQGLVMGLLSAMEGVAAFLGLGLVALLSPVWIQPDTTHFLGHLDWFFYLLALLQVLMLIYCVAVIWFKGQRRNA